MKFNKPILYATLSLGITLTPLSAKPEAWQKHIHSISSQVKANPDQPNPKQAQIDTCLRTIKTSLAANDYNQVISQLNNLRAYEPKAVKSTLELSEQLIDALV